MDSLSYKTPSATKKGLEKKWVLVDATDKVLGRLTSEVAKIIRGKHKPVFTPNVDCGDHVVVINADKIKLTGAKWTDKQYVSHSGYPGGQKFATPLTLKAQSSTLIIEKAVKGMLPKNRLSKQVFKNLHVFEGTEHPYDAQKPEKIEL